MSLKLFVLSFYLPPYTNSQLPVSLLQIQFELKHVIKLTLQSYSLIQLNPYGLPTILLSVTLTVTFCIVSVTFTGSDIIGCAVIVMIVSLVAISIDVSAM